MERLYRLPVDTEGAFHSEVYFINKTVLMAVKWGTPEKVRFIDPLTGTPLALGASGEMNLQVADSRKLLVKLVGTMKGIAWEEGPGFTKSLQASFRPMIASAVKTNLPAVIRDEAIDLLEIDGRLDLISSRLRDTISSGFEEYGLTVPQFYVTNIVLPEDDPNFKRIRELHTITLQTRMVQADSVIKTAQAQAKAQYRTAEEQSVAAIEAARREAERKVIAAQAEAQAQRMAGLTEAEIMKAKGYSQRDVLQAEVQKAYAEGIGNMGPAIAAGGGGSGGVMGDLLGLGVGLAAAKAVSPQIGDMLQGLGGFSNAPATLPEIPDASADVWDCPACGAKNIRSKFCPDCGGARPTADTWTCPVCGATGIRSRFCPDCGTKKPEAAKGWTCPSCGAENITSKFCPECGHKREG